MSYGMGSGLWQLLNGAVFPQRAPSSWGGGGAVVIAALLVRPGLFTGSTNGEVGLDGRGSPDLPQACQPLLADYHI